MAKESKPIEVARFGDRGKDVQKFISVKLPKSKKKVEKKKG